jgi:hypothetical protein
MGIRSRSYSDRIVMSAILGHKAGHTHREISDMIGVPRTTIRDWISGYYSDRITLDEELHAHVWVIEPPTGPSSIGTCSICLEKMEFPNYIKELTSWTRGT